MKIFEIFFPSHCVSCETTISKNALFCSNCWSKLQFISSPKCAICSYPFEAEAGHQPLRYLCGRCLEKRPHYDKSVTIFCYNHLLKKIIGDLKYRDQTFLAKKFARILFKKSQNEITDCDLLVAVPLHFKRLRKRKFNQAVLLCKNMLKSARSINKKIEFHPDFLLRNKHTKAQVELRKKEREKNLRRVFVVKEKYRDLVRGKKILLIDDVATTGATLDNCAKELKRRGAREVVVVTVAKTVLGRI